MLPVSNIVRVGITLSPLAAARRSFGVLMIMGDSSVINSSERYRTYTSLSGVVADFGTTLPEYTAAALYFSQSPKPNTLMIGRWLRTASNGILVGGILTTAQKAISNFTGITNGGLVISIDGVVKTLTGLNFSSITTINNVADVINVALTGATIAYNGTQFVVTSNTTGATSIVSFATTGSGTDLSVLLRLTAATAVNAVNGSVAESAATAVGIVADRSANWYGLMFNASVQPTASDYIAVAALIEGQNLHRMFGVTTTDTNSLSAASTTDVGAQLTALGYNQTFVQYSQFNKRRVCFDLWTYLLGELCIEPIDDHGHVQARAWSYRRGPVDDSRPLRLKPSASTHSLDTPIIRRLFSTALCPVFGTSTRFTGSIGCRTTFRTVATTPSICLRRRFHRPMPDPLRSRLPCLRLVRTQSPTGSLLREHGIPTALAPSQLATT